MEMKKVMKFEGTVSRTVWWIAPLVAALVFSLIATVAATVVSQGPTSDSVAAVIVMVSMIASMWFVIAINKARFNEAGWSGWWMFVPIVNLVVPGFFGPEEKDES